MTTRMMMAALLVAGWFGVSAARAAEPPVVTVKRLSAPEKALRFEVVVPASLDDVWTAFATKDGLQTWLWADMKIDLREKGDWLVLYPGGKTGGGTILSFVPKRQLVVAALAPESFPTVRAERTRAVFDFESLTPASTKVVLTQTGWKQGQEWDQAYDYLAEGNAMLLTSLYRRFVTGPRDWAKP